MTINDATPYPMEDPEQLGPAFGEVFDLVDETVEGVTDAEVEQRLRQLLADTATPGEAVDLNDLDRVLPGPSWNVSHRLDPTTLASMTGQAAWDEAHCALHVAREQLVVARAAADAARREAAEQRAAAAAAQQQAEEVTAGVNAYVDAALDRAESVLANARAEAARLVAEAEQQAEEILAAARARTVSAEVTPIAQAWPKARCLVVTSSVGSGKTAWFAALNAILTRLNDERCYFGDGPDHWQPAAIETLLPPAAVHPTRTSGITTWGELAQQVNRLLTNQAGLPHELTGPTADLYRNGLVAGNSPAQHLRDALRALDVMPPQLIGSYRRAVRVYYSSHTHELDVDLCVALDRPNVPLAPDDGRPEDGGKRERLWAMVAPPENCSDLIGFDVDGDGENRLSETGEGDQPRTSPRPAFQAKQHGTDADWRQAASIRPKRQSDVDRSAQAEFDQEDSSDGGEDQWARPGIPNSG